MVNRSELNRCAEGQIKKLRPTVFLKEDGLKSIECNGGNQPAGWQDQEGKIWIPTTKGISVIDPEISLNLIILPEKNCLFRNIIIH